MSKSWLIEDNRPVFRVILPCKFGCCAEKWFCHDEGGRDRIWYEEVKFGEFVLHVVVCGHYYAPWMMYHEIAEFVEELYGPLRSEKGGGRGETAFQYGVSHRYFWNVCGNCGREASDDRWREYENRIPSHWPRRFALSCSIECDLIMRGYVCQECGKPAAPPTRDDTRQTLSACEFSRDLFRLAAAKRVEFSRHIKSRSLFCSIECCSLAVDRVLRIERENANIQGELQCVHDVRKLLHKARKEFAKGIPSREVLHTLKQEFARAESLQE